MAKIYYSWPVSFNPGLVTNNSGQNTFLLTVNPGRERLIKSSQGYDVKALADLLNIRPAEVKSYLRGQLAPGRTQQLKQDMLAVGIPV